MSSAPSGRTRSLQVEVTVQIREKTNMFSFVDRIKRRKFNIFREKVSESVEHAEERDKHKTETQNGFRIDSIHKINLTVK